MDPRVSKDVEDLRRRIWLIEQKLGMKWRPVAKTPVIELAAPPPKPAHNEVISRLMHNVDPYEVSPVPVAKSRPPRRLINEQPRPQAAPPHPVAATSISALGHSCRSRQHCHRRAAAAAPIPVEVPRHPEPPPAPRPYPIPKPPPDVSMEPLIGGRWYAWIGAWPSSSASASSSSTPTTSTGSASRPLGAASSASPSGSR